MDKTTVPLGMKFENLSDHRRPIRWTMGTVNCPHCGGDVALGELRDLDVRLALINLLSSHVSKDEEGNVARSRLAAAIYEAKGEIALGPGDVGLVLGALRDSNYQPGPMVKGPIYDLLRNGRPRADGKEDEAR